MTPRETELIRESFAHLHRRKAETAQLFYDRLFAIAPETRPLFKTDSSAQGAKLMETFSVALATLNDREGLDILLRRLGRNHRSYGVEDRHYAKACEALIWTIKTSLGSGYTPEIEGAWQALYDHMARVMIEASPAP